MHSVGLMLISPVYTRVFLQMTGSNEYKLNQGPEDSISAVKFSPSTAQNLLVSSWDCTVRLYDAVSNTMRMKYQHSAPVLDCAFYVSHEFVNKFRFPVILLYRPLMNVNSLVLFAGPSTFLEWRVGCAIKNSWFEHRPRYVTNLCHRSSKPCHKFPDVITDAIDLYFLLTDTIVGTHDAPIRCVEYCPEVNVMVTGSWDRSVRLWDPRTPCNAGTFTQPEKVKQK